MREMSGRAITPRQSQSNTKSIKPNGVQIIIVVQKRIKKNIVRIIVVIMNDADKKINLACKQ